MDNTQLVELVQGTIDATNSVYRAGWAEEFWDHNNLESVTICDLHEAMERSIAEAQEFWSEIRYNRDVIVEVGGSMERNIQNGEIAVATGKMDDIMSHIDTVEDMVWDDDK